MSYRIRIEALERRTLVARGTIQFADYATAKRFEKQLESITTACAIECQIRFDGGSVWINPRNLKWITTSLREQTDRLLAEINGGEFLVPRNDDDDDVSLESITTA